MARLRSAASIGSEPILLAALAIAAFLACTFAPGVLRAAGGVALALYLPGRAVRLSLRLPPQGVVVEVIIDISVSVCSVVLSGFVVNLFRQGIQRSTMAWALTAITVAAVVIGALGSRAPAGRTRIRPAGAARGLVLPLAVFVILAAAAVWFARTSAISADHRVATTELSIGQPVGGEAQIEITNEERRSMSYSLVVSSVARDLPSQTLSLAAGATWRGMVSTAGLAPGSRVTAVLNRAGETSPYRQVWVVLPGSSSTSGGGVS